MTELVELTKLKPPYVGRPTEDGEDKTKDSIYALKLAAKSDWTNVSGRISPGIDHSMNIHTYSTVVVGRRITALRMRKAINVSRNPKNTMKDFSIITRLTTKEYAKIMFVGLYKKPAFILATIFGLYFILTLILDYFNIRSFYTDTPYFEISCGLFLLLAPSLIVMISVRQFISNPCFKNDITYIFSEAGMKVQGLTFKGEFVWTHIIKQKEIGKFLILYHSKKAGNFIDKTKLTSDQLKFIKAKVEKR